MAGSQSEGNHKLLWMKYEAAKLLHPLPSKTRTSRRYTCQTCQKTGISKYCVKTSRDQRHLKTRGWAMDKSLRGLKNVQ